MEPTSIIIGSVIGLVIGGIAVFIIQKSILKSKADTILKKAEDEGESIKKDKILQAKERFLQLKDEHEKGVRNRERNVQSLEDKIKSKEKKLNQQLEDANRKEKVIEGLNDEVKVRLDLIEAKKMKSSNCTKNKSMS